MPFPKFEKKIDVLVAMDLKKANKLCTTRSKSLPFSNSGIDEWGDVSSTKQPSERQSHKRSCTIQKLDEVLFWKSIVAREKLQEKLQEAVCCRFFQGSVELLKNVSSKSGLGSTWLVWCKNENCLLQITNEAFSTTKRIEQSRAFEINCSSVVGFRFKLFLLCHYCCPFSGSLLLSFLWYASTLTALVL